MACAIHALHNFCAFCGLRCWSNGSLCTKLKLVVVSAVQKCQERSMCDLRHFGKLLVQQNNIVKKRKRKTRQAGR